MSDQKEGEKQYKFFRHEKCEYFPCHDHPQPHEFNCLFCYCPLYFMGEECRGNYRLKNGIKSCVHCSIPHTPQGYDIVQRRLKSYFIRQKEEPKNHDEP